MPGGTFCYKTSAQFLHIAQENKSELWFAMFEVFTGTGSVTVSGHSSIRLRTDGREALALYGFEIVFRVKQSPEDTITSHLPKKEH